MEYEAMSDKEINIKVASLIDDDDVFLTDGVLFRLGVVREKVDVDYCNNPSDAWPIILEHKIHTGWAFDDMWRAEITNQGQSSPFRKEEAVNENPLRAAMIAFLKMTENTNG